MVDFQKILQILQGSEVDFVLIGGAAMIAHGSAYVTRDVDICYDRSRENLRRLVQALLPYHPRLRAPNEDVPILWDEFTLHNGLNFTLRTDLGDIDILGEVTALGSYKDALAASDVMEAYGRTCRVLNLDSLIRTKKAAGRRKDLLAIPELEALKEIQDLHDDESPKK